MTKNRPLTGLWDRLPTTRLFNEMGPKPRISREESPRAEQLALCQELDVLTRALRFKRRWKE